MPLEHGRNDLALRKKPVSKVRREAGNVVAGGSKVMIAITRVVPPRTGNEIGELLEAGDSGGNEHPLYNAVSGFADLVITHT